jgi:type IV pilus assembly protein PilA
MCQPASSVTSLDLRKFMRRKIQVRETDGFSLTELMIVVAIILIIAAIAIPNLLRARMAANEASAIVSVITINTSMVTYSSAYPAIGFAGSLSNLGGVSPCPPSSTSACLIDSVLASGTKSGYSFVTSAGGPPASQYDASAVPTKQNQIGIRSLCSFEDLVVRVQPTGAAIASEGACQGLLSIGQDSQTGGGGGVGAGGGGAAAEGGGSRGDGGSGSGGGSGDDGRGGGGSGDGGGTGTEGGDQNH